MNGINRWGRDIVSLDHIEIEARDVLADDLWGGLARDNGRDKDFFGRKVLGVTVRSNEYDGCIDIRLEGSAGLLCAGFLKCHVLRPVFAQQVIA